MKLFKCCLVFFSIFYISNDTAWAQQCIAITTQVVFANGVNQTPRQAKISKRKIKKLIDSELTSNDVSQDFEAINQAHPGVGCDGIVYGLQFNPNNGLLLDLFESLQQDFITDTSRFWLILSGLDIMPNFFRDKLLKIAQAVDEVALVNPVTQGFVDVYNSSLGSGDTKIIAVSHSQGNLFSNTIHANLNGTAQNNYKIVSVANPDSFVAGGGPYTTLDTDLVILAVRVVKSQIPPFSEPLPANTTNATFGELTGHDFLKSYLQSGSNSQIQIIDDIFNLIELKDIPPVDCPPPGIPLPNGDCVVI